VTRFERYLLIDFALSCAIALVMGVVVALHI
jgi:hypothetical protein